MIFFEQFAHRKICGGAESRDPDFAALEIRNAGNRWIRHHVERHRIGHCAHSYEIAAREIGVDDHLTVRRGDIYVPRNLRLSNGRGARNIDQFSIESLFLEKSGIVHDPKRRVERAHRRPANGQVLRMKRRGQENAEKRS